MAAYRHKNHMWGMWIHLNLIHFSCPCLLMLSNITHKRKNKSSNWCFFILFQKSPGMVSKMKITLFKLLLFWRMLLKFCFIFLFIMFILVFPLSSLKRCDMWCGYSHFGSYLSQILMDFASIWVIMILPILMIRSWGSRSSAKNRFSR